jgi:hypothetical protein
MRAYVPFEPVALPFKAGIAVLYTPLSLTPALHARFHCTAVRTQHYPVFYGQLYNKLTAVQHGRQ